MRVSDVMSRHPAICIRSNSAQTAAAMMKESDIGILPVVEDNYTRRLVGVITDRDLCLGTVASGRNPNHTWVEDHMSEEPVFCIAEDSVNTVLEIMKRHQVRRVPVVDNDKVVVGMVSIADLVRHNAVDAGELLSAMKKIFAPTEKAKAA